MEKLYEELLAIKQEIKNAIEASEVRLLLKLESYNEKFRKLEKENTELKQQMERLDRYSRRNNIIVFGLCKSDQKSYITNICSLINSKLGLEIKVSDISNIYPLGKSSNCPVKIELSSTITKNIILQNSKKLKGTKIGISSDLTKQQQQTNKILRSHLKKIRDSGEEGSYIKGEILYRNNIGYTVQDILEIEGSTDTQNHHTIASAPETPSRPPVVNFINESGKPTRTTEETEKKDAPLTPLRPPAENFKGDLGEATRNTAEESKEAKKKSAGNVGTDNSSSQRVTRERKNSANQPKHAQKNVK